MPFSRNEFGEEMTAPEMATKLVQKYCGDFMEVESAPVFGEVRKFARYEARPLSEIVGEILATADCGHLVKFNTDEKKWQFVCVTPEYTDIVLSKPDNSLENCDYARSTDHYAGCGIYNSETSYV